MVCTCKRVLWAIVLAAATASGCAPEVPRRDERRQIQPLPGADGGGMLLLDAEAPAPQPPDAPPSSAPQCGNGKLETGEVCDGDSRACTEIDPAAFDGGAAACNSTCSSYDTKSCSRPATLADAIGTITEAVLKQDLGVIAADDHNGRYPGSAGELKTRSYLTSGLSSFGLKPAPTGAGLLQSFSWNGTDGKCGGGDAGDRPDPQGRGGDRGCPPRPPGDHERLRLQGCRGQLHLQRGR